MNVDDNFSLFGAGGLFSDGIFLGQLGLLALALLLFAGSLALCVIALRAAASARDSQSAAIELHAAVERQSSQMQLLGADVERMAQDVAARQQEITAQYHAPPQPGAQSDQDAAATDADFQSGNEPVRRAFDQPETSPEQEATVPKSLLRGLLRRR